MPSVSGIPIKQIDAAFLTGRAVFFFRRSVVQIESTAVSKTSDFGSSPDRSAMALWCKIAAFGNDGNTSGSQYIRL